MQLVDGDAARMVAVLHDVVEDTTVTLDDLRRAGFLEEVLEAVRCVTHRKGESYADYVVRCRGNPVARMVKIADLTDNSRLDRTILRPDRLDRDRARLMKYVLAYKFLTDQLGEAEYRRLTAEVGG
jgi:hypothetical protein